MKSASPLRLAGATALLALASTNAAFAEAWSFGVLGDTQWVGTDPTGNNINTVAVNQINACNQAFVAAGVDFVVQVGDLGDNGSTASLKTRLDANKLLNDAGIAFYGLRGNHESSSTAKTYFQQNYLPTSSDSVSVNVASFDNASYTVTYKNTKIALLDYGVTGNVTNLNSATTWLNTQLQADDHQQAFVFAHKNLLGENHKDNLFGSNNDANPTQQNAFISTLANNGVKQYISGHDHIHNRSVVTSPDGQSSVQQLICASDSYKYYDPANPTSSRETQIAQQQDKTGYYIYTVDGPRVTGKYFATTPQANGDVPANAIFTLQETFGYSLNGKEVQVARGQTKSLHDDTSLAATMESGFLGTTADLIFTSTNTDNDALGRAFTKVINTGWAAATEGLFSDVLTIWGNDVVEQSTADPFTLTLSYVGDDWVRLVQRDANGNWVTAGSNVSIDAENNLITATLLGGGDFAVIPEPSTYAAICGVLTLGFSCFRRKRHLAKI